MHNKKMNRLRKLLPVFTWIGIFLTPLLITILEGRLPSMDWYLANFLLVCSICIIFYVDFYLLVDRFIIEKNKYGMFLTVNAILAILLIFADYNGIGHILKNREVEEVSFLLGNIFSFSSVCFILLALSVSLSVSIRMTDYSYKSDVKISEIQKMQAETELANLKNQINPHFLFNTLNNIYALISVDATMAQSAVHDLSHLLRYIIYDTSPIEVPLAGEIDFVKKYVHIEELRLDKKIDTQIDLPDNCGNLKIAPLLLIPFIENAFKHGISHSKKSFVHITISLRSDVLTCHIVNSNHAKNNASSGVGIQNTTKRLNLLYPDRYTLQYGKINENTYETFLSIRLQQ